MDVINKGVLLVVSLLQARQAPKDAQNRISVYYLMTSRHDSSSLLNTRVEEGGWINVLN